MKMRPITPATVTFGKFRPTTQQLNQTHQLARSWAELEYIYYHWSENNSATTGRQYWRAAQAVTDEFENTRKTGVNSWSKLQEACRVGIFTCLERKYRPTKHRSNIPKNTNTLDEGIEEFRNLLSANRYVSYKPRRTTPDETKETLLIKPGHVKPDNKTRLDAGLFHREADFKAHRVSSPLLAWPEDFLFQMVNQHSDAGDEKDKLGAFVAPHQTEFKLR